MMTSLVESFLALNIKRKELVTEMSADMSIDLCVIDADDL